MGSHLTEDGLFQSNKYPDTPAGLVPLKPSDPMAQDILYEYAQRQRAVDPEFADDLEQALRNAGYARDPKDVALYFFGCWDRPGLYWRSNSGAELTYDGPVGWPFGHEIDGRFCCIGPEVQGKAWLWHSKGWSIVSMWDRSVDKRGACNASFVAPEPLTFDQMMSMARERYPEFFKRIDYGVELDGRPRVGVPKERR